MKAPKRLLVPALVATLTACATLMPDRPPEQNAEFRLDRGLSALQAGLFAEGFEDLAWVYSHCSGRQAGSQALNALAALELDPRNRAARPAVGAELLGRVIQDPGAPDWVRPLAATAFLAGLALGAPHPGEDAATGEDHGDHEARPGEPVRDLEADAELPGHPGLGVPAAGAARSGTAYGCGPTVAAEEWVAPALPTLTGPSMVELLENAHQRRAVAVASADTLRKELALVKAQLESTRAELERIRETLKP